MDLTPTQIAGRYMATEVETVNRYLATKDISQAKAKLMLAQAAHEARQFHPDVVIKFGIHAGRAWFNVL